MKKFLLIAALLVAACTPKNSQNFNIEQSVSIIGGEPVSASHSVRASTVSLVYTYGGDLNSFCTGTLISPDLILTATHCLEAMDGMDFFVYFGETLPKKFDRSQVVAIKKTVVHPSYGPVYDSDGRPVSGVNDIGLIHLAKVAPEGFAPVAILDESVSLQVGQTMLLAGYGVVNDRTHKSATGLNMVRVPLHKIEGHIIVTDQTKTMGACAGDSGGPAYLETEKGLVVYGITRGPHGFVNDCHHYGEYTYASKFQGYILEEAQKLGAELPTFIIPR